MYSKDLCRDISVDVAIYNSPHEGHWVLTLSAEVNSAETRICDIISKNSKILPSHHLHRPRVIQVIQA